MCELVKFSENASPSRVGVKYLGALVARLEWPADGVKAAGVAAEEDVMNRLTNQIGEFRAAVVAKLRECQFGSASDERVHTARLPLQPGGRT